MVSQLEYEMQPIHLEVIRLSKLIRSYAAELLNSGISDIYTIEIEIAENAENAVLEGDARLILRAISNLVQNSIKHNPDGCKICLELRHKKICEELSYPLSYRRWRRDLTRETMRVRKKATLYGKHRRASGFAAWIRTFDRTANRECS